MRELSRKLCVTENKDFITVLFIINVLPRVYLFHFERISEWSIKGKKDIGSTRQVRSYDNVVLNINGICSFISNVIEFIII